MKESASGQLSRLDECLSRNDLLDAFSELRVLGDEWGADHNFWRYLGSAAHDLGLSDDEETCRIKSDQDYSAKAIQMPDNCKGLPLVSICSIESGARLFVLMGQHVQNQASIVSRANGYLERCGRAVKREGLSKRTQYPVKGGHSR